MSSTKRISNLIKKNARTICPLMILLVLLVPKVVTDQYILRVANMIMLYGILSLSLNLVGGYAGQLALGHAGFYGIGAYTATLLMIKLKWSFITATVAATLIAALSGLLVGLPTLRVSGDYLIIVSIGFAEILRIIFLNWVDVTRGPMGIPGIPFASIAGYQFRTSQDYYYLYLACLVLTILVVYRIVHSKVGRALVAIREDELAAAAMGINTTYYKVEAFTLSAALTGMAGSLLAVYLRFIGPMSFNLDESLLMFQMIILGGLASIPGSILGAAILVLIPEVFRPLYAYRMLINGLIMVLLMIWRPQGIMGTIAVGRKKKPVQPGPAQPVGNVGPGATPA
ncbi:MAG: branched-chain amino acid ABC transporter permease [Firmicutes bacterium]|nr:branched-chain amino acid ABC transporter permease [Bacillota bacterium]